MAEGLSYIMAWSWTLFLLHFEVESHFLICKKFGEKQKLSYMCKQKEQNKEPKVLTETSSCVISKIAGVNKLEKSMFLFSSTKVPHI